MTCKAIKSTLKGITKKKSDIHYPGMELKLNDICRINNTRKKNKQTHDTFQIKKDTFKIHMFRYQ